MSAPVLAAVRETFRAVAATVVPETASLHSEGWHALEAMVERALAARPLAVRRQVVKFLRLVEYSPVLRHGATFRGLSPERRLAWLQRFEVSRFAPLRRGLWGVRTLVFLGYYSQRDVQTALGYRAHPDGWHRRRTGEHPVITEHA